MTFLIESWFWRGTQSAIFYYLSCAPCTKVSDQRKKKRDAKRAKAERAMTGTFRHPLPSGTNPGWNEEIVLGPGPPPKRLKKEDIKRRDRLLLSMKPPLTRDLQSAGAPSSTGTGTTSMDTVDGQAFSQDLSRTSREDWNKQRYQREDEVLWGLERAETDSSNGSAPISRSAGGTSYRYYARNPEVNELHPPIVSTQPISRAETQWMLQPPPKAKFMEGKEGANRSRSGSGNSRGSGATSRASSRRGEENLGRRIGERSVGIKLAKRECPPQAPSSHTLDGQVLESRRSSSSLDPKPPPLPGGAHDRDPKFFELPTRLGRCQLAGQLLPSEPPLSCSNPPEASQSTIRPPLSTIPSASAYSPQSPSPIPGCRPLRSPLVPTDSTKSLSDIQQPLAAGRAKDKKEKEPSMIALCTPGEIKLPPPTPLEEKRMRFPPDIDSPKHLARSTWEFPSSTIDLRTDHRRSMDI